MEFDWHDFYSLAEELNHLAPELEVSSAAYRSVISRVYYSVFGLARSYLLNYSDIYVEDRVISIHEHVIDFFNHLDDDIFKEIGEELNRLKLKRIDADYDVTFGSLAGDSLAREALHSIISAKFLIGNIDGLPQEL